MNNKHKQYVDTLAGREQIAAIVWLIIGILQICTFIFSIAGAWNIYASITRFRQAKLVKSGYPGLVNSYDKWLPRLIVGLLINLFLGGVIGAAGSLYDIFFVRGYVLDNKQTFAEIEADPSLAQ